VFVYGDTHEPTTPTLWMHRQDVFRSPPSPFAFSATALAYHRTRRSPRESADTADTAYALDDAAAAKIVVKTIVATADAVAVDVGVGVAAASHRFLVYKQRALAGSRGTLAVYRCGSRCHHQLRA
jgi:hypothetical protein